MNNQAPILTMPKWKEVSEVFAPSPKYQKYYDMYDARKEPEFEKSEDDPEALESQAQEEEDYRNEIKYGILHPDAGKPVETVNPCKCVVSKVGFRHMCSYCKNVGKK